jgi:hypothetical protein
VDVLMSFATRSGGCYVPYLFQLRQESQLESDGRGGARTKSRRTIVNQQGTGTRYLRISLTMSFNA